MTTDTLRLFPPFSEIQAATQTIIVQINAHFDLDVLYRLLPVHEPVKTESDNHSIDQTDDQTDTTMEEAEQKSTDLSVPVGTLLGLSYNGESRGEMSARIFKNSLVMRMFMGQGRISNFKLSRLGKVQVTGVKTDQEYVMPTLYLLRHVQACQSKHPTVVRKIPSSIQRSGYHCWAVIVMHNTYINLPYSQDLNAVKEFILRHPEYGFTPTYEQGVTQALAIKAKSRFKPEEMKRVEHPYFVVTETELSGTAVPGYTMRKDSVVNLRAVEERGKVLDKAEHPPKSKPKPKSGAGKANAKSVPNQSRTRPHPTVLTSNHEKTENVGTLLTYETNRTFMSVPGIEASRMYDDFCAMMTAYYETSSATEKASVRKSCTAKPVVPVSRVIPAEVVDPLTQRMEMMRSRRLIQRSL
jgi:hypothetical protein